ncbi:YbgC/YbaW family acyl-CoA thioester hydrolase [Lysinibacillus composti]|uniref:Acyl-CoA thioesterase n=1 Tax=Lysinibacillus composti TaxID=720633 RepID=A0A3N9UES1_9BACI|nr:thioesterase family protein [Lysinibacillus composti]MBM7608443.1 YbgC/YbaW family acyl-CoA thioester hydrolase [Lysinibacillus composti]RQW74739.1 acyl-CoA thioesterase [Lysinibacillus composti]
MEHVKKYTIVESDIDELGHMNYLKYVKHFEKARFEWMKEIGLSTETLLGAKLGTVLLKFDTEYRKEVRLGDTVEIRTKLKKVGNKSFTLEQLMYHGELLSSTTNVILTIMDLQTRKAIPVPDEIAKLKTNIN